MLLLSRWPPAPASDAAQMPPPAQRSARPLEDHYSHVMVGVMHWLGLFRQAGGRVGAPGALQLHHMRQCRVLRALDLAASIAPGKQQICDTTLQDR